MFFHSIIWGRHTINAQRKDPISHGVQQVQRHPSWATGQLTLDSGGTVERGVLATMAGVAEVI